jgi:subtilisin family serine protease
MMIVRNILDIAPEATIFDCPLLWELPGHITDIPRSLEDAHRAYERMITDINSLRQKPRWQGPWIFANAWAVYDRKSDYGDVKYSDNPDHPFNKSVAKAVEEKIEIVFCAGNCGQFCPDPACGMNDRGPGQSILGANSHPDVLTVAAVRTDALWLGYSSQGPGLLEPQGSPVPTKPDLSAASQFCEMDDEHATNTGTSAACALTAGVVAALRSKWDCTMVPPEKLKDILKETATRIEEYEHDWQWRSRVGSGILNAERAYQKLASLSDNGP